MKHEAMTGKLAEGPRVGNTEHWGFEAEDDRSGHWMSLDLTGVAVQGCSIQPCEIAQ
jgi:hypothetical protein